jgi:DNA-binding NarL/FixJ family response regulator
MLHRLLAALPQFQVVGEAQDGSQALEAIAELHPDIVILDIRMPELNGLEVLESLQKQGSTCQALVFSQFADELYRNKCLQLGAQGFFDKVAGFDDFHRALKEMRGRP